MLNLILILLAVWLVLALLGIIVKGLFWLFIIGAVLFAATAVWGWIQNKSR